MISDTPATRNNVAFSTGELLSDIEETLGASRFVATSFFTPPWIDEIDIAVGKIVDVPSRELRCERSGNGGDWASAWPMGLPRALR